MKQKFIPIIPLLAMLLPACESDSQSKSVALEGFYVGQATPGLTPETFSPVVSSEYRDYGGSFTPDMKEYYTTRRHFGSDKMSSVVFKFENNQWQETVIGPREGGSFISPDGKVMHAGKRYRERLTDGWSDLKSLGSDFENFRIMRLTSSLHGTYAFDEIGTNGNGVLRYSRLVNGKRETPKPFPKAINTGKWTAHPFIAPDESYLLWDSEREGGFGSTDLYVSFKQPDGSWGEAINFGDKINTDGEDGGGYVTPDGKYLMYCRRCSPNDFEIMWVDAQIIEDLRPNTQDSKSGNQPPEATNSEAELAFRDIPVLDNVYIETAPLNRNDDVTTGKLGIDGGNREEIVKLAKEIAAGQHGNYDSMLIAQNGKLLFESYYLRGRINLPHPQASTTKAYTGLAVGRAIQLGYLTMADLDKPLTSFLKGLDTSKFVAGTEKITLHKAMTMQSGIRLTKEQRDAFDKNPEQLIGLGQVQTILENTAPITSQDFLYQDDPSLVIQVLEAVVPGSVEDFIKNEVLHKMGITNYRWRTSDSGLPAGGWGSSMTSRDMIKWGTLVTNGGKWQNQQLVPEAFVAKALSKIVPMENDDIFFTTDKVINPGYGYYWWHADMQVGDKVYSTVSAQGGSGQMIILVEELDLMVITTVHRLEGNVLQLTAERILPAFM